MEAKEKGEGCFGRCAIRFGQFKKSMLVAFCYTLICAIISLIIFFILYTYIAKTEIPYRQIMVSVNTDSFAPVTTTFTSRLLPCINGQCECDLAATGVAGGLCPCGLGDGCNGSNDTVVMDVTFVIFLAATLSFIGWFIFSIYVGIGFIALPLDCFNAFRFRPRMLSTSQARDTKKALRLRAEDLIKIGEEMAARLFEAYDHSKNKRERNKAGKVHRTELNRFKLLVDMLEKDLDDFQISDPDSYKSRYNPLVPFAKLIFGIISVVLTLAWLVHIIIYMLFNPPIHPFINEYLSYFDKFFPLFGTLTIGIFALYLLLAASKGAAKFGTRFFLISVHELEPHKTLINTFLFNVQLVLLCVLPTVQFCTDAFSTYSRYTEADVIFGSQVCCVRYSHYHFY